MEHTAEPGAGGGRAAAALFGTFFRIGLFTFGGGYAMLPLIEDLCVEKRGWITHEEMARITVVAESTPGPVAINCATYVGKRRAGFPGALAATAGVVLPSFLIILALSRVLDRFLTVPWAANAFRGIRVAVALLILRAGLRMLGRLEKKPLPLGLFAFGLGAMGLINALALPVSTVWLLGLAGGIGLAVRLVQERRGGGRP